MMLIKKNHYRMIIVTKIISIALKEETTLTSIEIQQQSHRIVKTENYRIITNFSNVVSLIDQAPKHIYFFQIGHIN